MNKISFGTDGWRGILARDFTFANVELVTEAVADYVYTHGLVGRGVVVGHDNRFLAEQFADAVCGTLTGRGVPVFITRRATPTPVVAFAVKVNSAAGAVMLTASHNPPEYNGFKFIPEYAGPALPDTTREIEDNIRRRQERKTTGQLQEVTGRVTGEAPTCEIETFPLYAAHLAKIVDLAAIGRAGLKVAVDPMYGAGIDYLESILERAGAQVEVIHNYRDPLFGGALPDPTAQSLSALRELVLVGGAHLGLALDGDADRFGIIDTGGEFITPNQFLPLLLYHLITVRELRGPVVRTVATTHLLDRVAACYGLPVEETPVGFKYIGQCLAEKGAILGGEESGGLSIKGHIPEKDGILAGLLAAEMVAIHGKSLTALLEQVADECGHLYSERLDVHTSPAEKERILALLKDLTPKTLAGLPVVGRNSLDGTKLLLKNGAWVLIRPSGTEPLFRIYVEANTPAELKEIQGEVKEMLGL